MPTTTAETLWVSIGWIGSNQMVRCVGVEKHVLRLARSNANTMQTRGHGKQVGASNE